MDPKHLSLADIEELRLLHTNMKIEPWATAMLKYMEARVTREPRDSMEKMNARDIHMMFKGQNYKCALTGREFIQIKNSDIKGRAYRNWLKGLSPEDKIAAPIPVCVTEERVWKYDTIIFITYPMYQFYQASGGTVTHLWNMVKNIEQVLQGSFSVPLNNPDQLLARKG
jgi:hypothetical protein